MTIESALTIWSGGQTGVDRAALDFAIESGIPYGGWTPLGGWAEDLVEAPGLLKLYPGLRESTSDQPAVRTEYNVRDSDATLILLPRTEFYNSPGTMLTEAMATAHNKPCLVLQLNNKNACDELSLFVSSVGCDAVFNIAGPRESECPGIYNLTREFLISYFASRCRHVHRGHGEAVLRLG